MLAVVESVETEFVKLVVGYYSLFHIYVIYISVCLSLSFSRFTLLFKAKRSFLFHERIDVFFGLAYFQAYFREARGE
jgi:hypothetical protein